MKPIVVLALAPAAFVGSLIGVMVGAMLFGVLFPDFCIQNALTERIFQNQGRIRAVSGQWTTEDGLKTKFITVTIVADDDIAGYDPERDADLHEYWKAEARY